MVSANQLKFITALQVKKFRQKYQKFTVEGEKMLDEALEQNRIEIEAIFALPDWIDRRQAQLAQFEGAVHAVDERALRKMSALVTPQSGLALARIPAPSPDAGVVSGSCFYLDGLQDPGNVGTIWRIADWFGMPALYCSPDCADPYAPKTVQASMGAVFRVPAIEISAPELLSANPGIPLWGADMEGLDFFSISEWPVPSLLAIGNEGRGLSAGVRALLSGKVCIPRSPTGGAESLNAAVAAGIFAAFIMQKTVHSPQK
ncbi:MAG: TrmH family RNA methyltransferase [Saprospiraceae bacterium]